MKTDWQDRGGRRVALGVLALTLVVVVGVAVRDLQARRAAHQQTESAALERLGRLAESLAQSDHAQRVSEMRQLRAELRRQDLWLGIQAASGAAKAEAAEAAQTMVATPARRRESMRRLGMVARALLAGSDALQTVEIVVAARDGLALWKLGRDALAPRAERTGDGIEVPDGTEVRTGEQDDRAQALWYAEDVQRAVVGAGRRVERIGLVAGEGIDGGPDISSQLAYRLSLALHEPGDIIQGVLVAQGDARGLARRIAALGGDGRSIELHSIAPPEAEAAPLAQPLRSREWLRRVRTQPGAPSSVFMSDGALVAGDPLMLVEGHPAELVWLAWTTLPGLLPSIRATALPAALLSLVSVSSVAVWILWGTGAGRRRAASESSPAPTPAPAPAPASAAAPHPPEEAVAGSPDSLPARSGGGRELFVLREWLADVRSCLERDAARCGLGLDMRCARSLPQELEADPVALGALLLLLGREALDSTADEKVAIEVFEQAESTLRFELETGGTPLLPLVRLEAVAAQLGAALETGQAGRTALVLSTGPH